MLDIFVFITSFVIIYYLFLQIMNQISATSNKIMHIKKSIADKEGYMALAHERLSRRCRRPGMELTQDLVEINLIKEIHELRNIVANLQQMLCEVRSLWHNFIDLNICLSSE